MKKLQSNINYSLFINQMFLIIFLHLIFRSSNTEFIQTLMPYCIELAMLTFTNIKYEFYFIFLFSFTF